MSERIRSFIAFDMENEAVLARLGAVQKQLVETGADLKMVAPQNIHVTLRFLGDISPTMVEKVYEAMKQVKFSPFTVQLCGLGVFPSLSYPRVVWVGMTQGAEQLKSIFSQLEPQIQSLGFPKDAYGFSPHLTTARVRSGKNKQQLAEFVTKKANYDFGAISADCLRLKKSVLSPQGPTYSTLREYCPQK
ncbi:MAG: RNA 2',3'-cyclic phosphodiesterase [Candidatus Bathyarchaeota archaeon]|nr:RNA 2',3'-cyclic phosphodiesterase [Candidatus Bathyarchaeota archaeon]